MDAYDYDKQKWVTGQEAWRVLGKQRAEVRELEKDPAYLKFIAKTCGECGGAHSAEDCSAERFHDYGCACDDCCDGYAI